MTGFVPALGPIEAIPGRYGCPVGHEASPEAAVSVAPMPCPLCDGVLHSARASDVNLSRVAIVPDVAPDATRADGLRHVLLSVPPPDATMYHCAVCVVRFVSLPEAAEFVI